MTNYQLPYIVEIDISALEDRYDAVLPFEGHDIQLDVNFHFEPITETKPLALVQQFINNLDLHHRQALAAIKEDYTKEDGEVTRQYLEFHLDDMDEEELEGIVDFSNTGVSKEEQMLNKLYLKRVGFYPAKDKHFAVADYTIGETLTDELIVVNFTKEGVVHCLSAES